MLLTSWCLKHLPCSKNHSAFAIFQGMICLFQLKGWDDAGPDHSILSIRIRIPLRPCLEVVFALKVLSSFFAQLLHTTLWWNCMTDFTSLV
jgi:hypothetical protein